MRIIKQGRPQPIPEGNSYTGACYNCGSEIECQNNETMFSKSAGMINNFVQCPTAGCSRVITVIPKMKDDLWKI